MRLGFFIGVLVGCATGALLAFPSRFPGGFVADPRFGFGEFLPPVVGMVGGGVGAFVAGVAWAVKSEAQEDSA